MEFMSRATVLIMSLVLLEVAHSSDVGQLPPPCRQYTSTVALIDCLQSQQEILQQVVKYYDLAAKLAALQDEIQSKPPASDIPDLKSSQAQSDPVIERVNWFDQQLEVYAVVGTPQELTAYARLEGREYRLREGDSFRLARVTKVHPRGVDLSVSGHEISIGLSGQTARLVEAAVDVQK